MPKPKSRHRIKPARRLLPQRCGGCTRNHPQPDCITVGPIVKRPIEHCHRWFDLAYLPINDLPVCRCSRCRCRDTELLGATP